MSQPNNPPAPADSPQDRHPLRGTALTLGIIGAAFVLVAIGLMVLGDQPLTAPSVGVTIRVGAVLLALSLVLPSVRKPSISTLLVVTAGLVLVLLRPALIWVGLLGVLLWLLSSRQRSAEASDS